eukprot:5297879-Ditylum_brightwellii.AAC.1
MARADCKQRRKDKNAHELTEHQEAHLIHYALTQYLLKRGLEKFKAKGEEAVMSEFKQLHDMETFNPLAINDLSKKDKHEALRAITFLKEKRCGRIKGR